MMMYHDVDPIGTLQYIWLVYTQRWSSSVKRVKNASHEIEMLTTTNVLFTVGALRSSEYLFYEGKRIMFGKRNDISSSCVFWFSFITDKNMKRNKKADATYFLFFSINSFNNRFLKVLVGLLISQERANWIVRNKNCIAASTFDSILLSCLLPYCQKFTLTDGTAISF